MDRGRDKFHSNFHNNSRIDECCFQRHSVYCFQRHTVTVRKHTGSRRGNTSNSRGWKCLLSSERKQEHYFSLYSYIPCQRSWLALLLWETILEAVGASLQIYEDRNVSLTAKSNGNVTPNFTVAFPSNALGRSCYCDRAYLKP